jgi:outer membrane biosynthesis protein TonB
MYHRVVAIALACPGTACASTAASVAPDPAARSSSSESLPQALGSGQRLSDAVNDTRYKPTLPPGLRQSGTVAEGLYKICVDTGGRVSSVEVVESASAMIDPRWMATMRTWQYRPFSIGGRPVPFCHPQRLRMRVP